MSVAGKANFVQPKHPMGKVSSKKNPGKVAFVQKNGSPGKSVSGKKVPGKVGFDQKKHAMGGTSSKKVVGKVGFDQPNPAKKTVATGVSGKAANVGPKMGKVSGQPKVSSPMKVPSGGFKSLDQLTSARKKHFGV